MDKKKENFWRMERVQIDLSEKTNGTETRSTLVFEVPGASIIHSGFTQVKIRLENIGVGHFQQEWSTLLQKKSYRNRSLNGSFKNPGIFDLCIEIQSDGPK